MEEKTLDDFLLPDDLALEEVFSDEVPGYEPEDSFEAMDRSI